MDEARPAPLVEIRSDPFPVFSSRGIEPVALRAAERVSRARDYLSRRLVATVDVRVKVLAPEHWHGHATAPVYGMPHFPDSRTLVVAGQENDFWRSIAPPPEALPEALRDSLEAVYCEPDGELRLAGFFDLLVVHELCHLFERQGSRSFARLWLLELFANLGLHAYVAAVEPEQLPRLETFPGVVVALGHHGMPHHTLTDFERLYRNLGPANYAWYQCQLHVAAKRLHHSGGDELLRDLWNRLRLATPGEISDASLLARLDAVDPLLAELQRCWPQPAGHADG